MGIKRIAIVPIHQNVHQINTKSTNTRLDLCGLGSPLLGSTNWQDYHLVRPHLDAGQDKVVRSG